MSTIQSVFNALLSAGLFQLSRRRLPQTSGSLHLAGLGASVEILRDRWGVPHIYATSVHDAMFAQGFVHAQDRLWQMDFQRRLAAGRLAEILGQIALPADRWLRTLGLRRVAEAEVGLIPADLRGELEAYAAGVNAFIERGPLPIEFTLLRYRPEPWTVADSISWSKMMAWTLSANWETELIRAQLIGRLGPELAAELEPGWPAHWPTIMPDNGAKVTGSVKQPFASSGSTGHLTVDEAGDRGALAAAAAARPFTGPTARDGVGSNNWVIAGARTATGRPLLANDMHLPMTAPAIWYENHLVARASPGAESELEVTGVTFPGIPGVVAGHNAHVAWGFTNGFPDVQDLYIEHLRRPDDGRVQYEFQGEWHDAEVRREEIRVKGGQAAVEEVIVTRHGPIIDSLAPELASYAAFKPEFDSGLNAAKHGVWSGLALRWTALEPSQTFLALHGMNRARSCAGFREALRYWSCPVQNTVYADTARNIAYSFPGLVPIRAKGDGQVPVPGWTGEYEWTGYVPFDELPHLVNPPQGYIATANNRVTGDDYPYFIGRAFCVGDRAQRIIELIESREKLDVPFIRRMHFDQISPTGRAVAAILANLTTDDPELGVVIALVRGWDGDLRPDSAAAAIYEVFMRRLLMVLLEGKLGQLAVHYAGKGPTPLLAETSMFGHLSWHWLATILGQPDSHWFTHVAGAGLPAAASQQQIRNEVLCRVLRETVDYLKAELGPNVHAWTWCRLHTLTYSHSLSSVPALAKLFNRGPYPLGGDDSTVWATGAGFHDAKGRSVIGPPFRFIADLGDWRNCLGLLTPGQSANPASPHYDDQAQAWFTGEYHPMLWERADVECEAKGRLRLTPQLGAEQNTHYAHPR